MQTVEIENISRGEARELYRKYRRNIAAATQIDREVMRAYQLIAQGKTVIKAIETIIKTGIGPDGFPKLALCQADEPVCFVSMWPTGGAVMRATERTHSHRPGVISNTQFDFRLGSFPGWQGYTSKHGRAIVPPIPVDVRPQAPQHHHVLWEAEWQPVPPRDPVLLKRIGKADLWLVIAQWNLTEVERAALQTRIAN